MTNTASYTLAVCAEMVFTDRPFSGNQLAVFTDARAMEPSLMQALDHIVQRHGKGAVQLASASLSHAAPPIWQMKQMRRTPGYTTDWNDLAIART